MKDEAFSLRERILGGPGFGKRSFRLFFACRSSRHLCVAAPSHRFKAAITSALNCGGDADTVGAIVGALSGASGGKNSIPGEWLDAIWEWPRSSSVVERIADRLTEQKSSMQPLGRVRYFWPAQIIRNLIFFVTVLVHGFYRLIIFWK